MLNNRRGEQIIDSEEEGQEDKGEYKPNDVLEEGFDLLSLFGNYECTKGQKRVSGTAFLKNQGDASSTSSEYLWLPVSEEISVTATL